MRPSPSIVMSRATCLFCSHDNPPGARFCNECGSPLHLKLCRECEAVCNSGDTTCNRCGATFAVDPDAVAPAAREHDVPSTAPEAEPIEEIREPVVEALFAHAPYVEGRSAAKESPATPTSLALGAPVAAPRPVETLAAEHGIAVLGPRRGVRSIALAILLATTIAAVGYIASLAGGGLDRFVEVIARQGSSIAAKGTHLKTPANTAPAPGVAGVAVPASSDTVVPNAAPVVADSPKASADEAKPAEAQSTSTSIAHSTDGDDSGESRSIDSAPGEPIAGAAPAVPTSKSRAPSSGMVVATRPAIRQPPRTQSRTNAANTPFGETPRAAPSPWRTGTCTPSVAALNLC